MAQAAGDLIEQGAPAIEASVPMLSGLLKAEMAEREVRSIAYQIKAARFPAYKDLAGFDFAASEINMAEATWVCGAMSDITVIRSGLMVTIGSPSVAPDNCVSSPGNWMLIPEAEHTSHIPISAGGRMYEAVSTLFTRNVRHTNVSTLLIQGAWPCR